MSRTAGRAAGLVLALALGGAARSVEAGVPDWARPFLDTGLPSNVTSHAARVLFSEDRVDVQVDGTTLLRHRLAVQALGRQAEDLPLGYFPFDDRTEILRSKAWHVPPGERARSASSVAVDLAVDDVFLSDAQVRFLHVPGVARGSLVIFEFEARHRPYVLVSDVVFGRAVPTDLERFELVLPRGWSARFAWLRRDPIPPVVTGDTWRWELRGLAAPREEPMGPPPAEASPRLVVAIVPAAGAVVEAAVLPEWIAFGDWFDRMASGRADVTPAVAAAAQAALAGVADGLVAHVTRLGQYTRDRVRYVAKEIGISGYRPRPAHDVLSQLWGDCKDKGTLLRALLAADGYASYPMLVHATENATVSSDVPSPSAFNHYVVGVPLPGQVDVPPDLASAVVDAGPLGPLLVVDVTDDRTSIGFLPEYLGGKTALVVAPGRSRLVGIPPGDPTGHRVEHRLSGEIDPAGGVAIRLDIARYGAPAADARARFRESEIEFRDAAARSWRERWPDVVVADHTVVVEAPDGAFVETLRLERRPVTATGDERPVDLFPSADDALPRVALGRREGAIVYPHPLRVSYAIELRGVPDSIPPPGGSSAGGTGWSVSAEATREGGVIRGTFELSLERLRFEPDSFPELRKLWSAAARAAALGVAIR